MNNLLGPQRSQGYLEMPAQANLEFPQANAMQLDAQLGWYFFVGSCTDAAGNEYGIEMMFFGGALLPPALAAQFGLSDIENQIFEMHFAIARAGDRHSSSISTEPRGTRSTAVRGGEPGRHQRPRGDQLALETLPSGDTVTFSTARSCSCLGVSMDCYSLCDGTSLPDMDVQVTATRGLAPMVFFPGHAGWLDIAAVASMRVR